MQSPEPLTFYVQKIRRQMSPRCEGIKTRPGIRQGESRKVNRSGTIEMMYLSQSLNQRAQMSKRVLGTTSIGFQAEPTSVQCASKEESTSTEY